MHLPMKHPASMIDAWFKLEDDVDRGNVGNISRRMLSPGDEVKDQKILEN